MSRAAAVRFSFPVYLASMCAHFIGSWLSDYVENQYFVAVQLFTAGLSSAVLVVLAPGISLWLLILGQGLGHGMNGICSTVLWPRYFGMKHLGAIYRFAMLGGVIVTVSLLGSAARSFIKRRAP